MTTNLAQQHCAPCEGGTKPMPLAQVEAQIGQLSGWRVVDGDPLKIARELRFEDFAQAMAFLNRLSEVAEAEAHHPDFCVSWNRVELELVTHAIGGLSDNDFIMAAKINELEGT